MPCAFRLVSMTSTRASPRMCHPAACMDGLQNAGGKPATSSGHDELSRWWLRTLLDQEGTAMQSAALILND